MQEFKENINGWVNDTANYTTGLFKVQLEAVTGGEIFVLFKLHTSDGTNTFVNKHWRQLDNKFMLVCSCLATGCLKIETLVELRGESVVLVDEIMFIICYSKFEDIYITVVTKSKQRCCE